MDNRPTRVLLTGATGFIGGRLLPALDAAGHAVRCLVRPGEKLVVRTQLARQPEVATADLLDAASLPAALEGMEAAYYLVHSMGGRSLGEIDAFAERDRRAATNFLAAAEAAGLSRIVYLGDGRGGRRFVLTLHNDQQVIRLCINRGQIKISRFQEIAISRCGHYHAGIHHSR